MSHFKALVHMFLLCTIPFLTANPIADIHSGTIQHSTTADLPFSYDHLLWVLDALESGELEATYGNEALEKLNFFLAFLAKEGALSEESLLDSDIEELLHKDTYSLTLTPFYGQRQFLPCRSWVKEKWDSTRKFVKEHKKEVIIGAVLLLAGGVIIYAVVTGSSAGAAAAGCAAAALGGSTFESEEPPNYVTPPTSPPLLTEPIETSNIRETIQEQISSFKDAIREDELLAARFEENPSGCFAREVASVFAHKIYDGIATIASIIPQCRDDVAQMRILLEEIERGFGISPRMPPENNSLLLAPSEIHAMEDHECRTALGHEKIDAFFGTSLAQHYTPEAKAHDPYENYYIGILPPPNMLIPVVGGISTAQKVLQAQQKAALLAEELGFASREIALLEKAGTLEVAVEDAFANIVRNPTNLHSWERINKAEEFLKPYQKKYLPEVEIRELIHQTGVKTFPKPPGIPENFVVKISRKGAGMEYIDPTNEHIRVRIMPGKPHSSLPHQQTPYVIQTINGKALDKFGNRVAADAPEAHIPVEIFIYRN